MVAIVVKIVVVVVVVVSGVVLVGFLFDLISFQMVELKLCLENLTLL